MNAKSIAERIRQADDPQEAIADYIEHALAHIRDHQAGNLDPDHLALARLYLCGAYTFLAGEEAGKNL